MEDGVETAKFLIFSIFVAEYNTKNMESVNGREVLGSRLTFYHTGLSPVDDESYKTSMRDQLLSFYFSMVRAGLDEVQKPKSWLEAFFMLEIFFRRHR